MYKINRLFVTVLIIFSSTTFMLNCADLNCAEALQHTMPSTQEILGHQKQCCKYRNIVFDLGGVLASLNIKKTIEKLQASGMVIPQEVIDQLPRILHLPEHLDYNCGRITTEEYCQKAAVKLLSDENNNHFVAIIHKAIDDDLKFDIAALELFVAVKAHGYKTYLLSNLAPYAEQCILKQDPSFFDQFDGVILSYKVHAAKPEPSMYTALFQTYNLKPEQCLFIDDLEVNIQGGRALGMDGIVCKNIDQVFDDLVACGVLPKLHQQVTVNANSGNFITHGN